MSFNHFALLMRSCAGNRTRVFEFGLPSDERISRYSRHSSEFLILSSTLCRNRSKLRGGMETENKSAYACENVSVGNEFVPQKTLDGIASLGPLPNPLLLGLTCFLSKYAKHVHDELKRFVQPVGLIVPKGET